MKNPSSKQGKPQPAYIDVKLEKYSCFSPSDFECSVNDIIKKFNDLKTAHGVDDIILKLEGEPYDDAKYYHAYHRRLETEEELKARLDREDFEKSMREDAEKAKLKELIAKFGIPK